MAAWRNGRSRDTMITITVFLQGHTYCLQCLSVDKVDCHDARHDLHGLLKPVPGRRGAGGPPQLLASARGPSGTAC